MLNIQVSQFGCELPKFVSGLGKAELDNDVVALDVAKAVQAGSQGFYARCGGIYCPETQVVIRATFCGCWARAGIGEVRTLPTNPMNSRRLISIA